MNVQSLKHAIASASPWAALVACAAMAACSKTPAIADAYVDAFVGGGDGCSSFSASTEFVKIGGSASTTEPQTVPDGTGNVSIQCTVQASGNGYQLTLGAAGPGNSRITITGNVTASGGTVKLDVSSDTVGAAFQASDCTLAYTYLRSAVPKSQALNPGEIFAHIDCTGAVQQGGAENPDGTPITCDANADFLFSNCDDGT
jgi:hypothetical protein